MNYFKTELYFCLQELTDCRYEYSTFIDEHRIRIEFCDPDNPDEILGHVFDIDTLSLTATYSHRAGDALSVYLAGIDGDVEDADVLDDVIAKRQEDSKSESTNLTYDDAGDWIEFIKDWTDDDDIEGEGDSDE